MIDKAVELIVSIHAPVRGATSKIFFLNRIKSFNPRTREGCDPVLDPTLHMMAGFQSTHP